MESFDPNYIGYKIISIVAIVLNLVALSMLFTTKVCHQWFKCPYLFLSNLVLVDLTVGIGAIAIFCHESKTHNLTFKILVTHGMFSSVVASVLLTLDRFIACVYPLRFNQWRTKRNTLVTWLMSWLLSGILQAIYHVSFKHNEDNDDKSCSRVAIAVVLLTFCIFIELMYMKILRALRNNRVNFQHADEERNLRKSRDKRISHLFHATVCCFHALTLPYVISIILQCSKYELYAFPYLAKLAFVAKSACNPVICIVDTTLRKRRKRRREATTITAESQNRSE